MLLGDERLYNFWRDYVLVVCEKFTECLLNKIYERFDNSPLFVIGEGKGLFHRWGWRNTSFHVIIISVSSLLWLNYVTIISVGNNLLLLNYVTINSVGGLLCLSYVTIVIVGSRMWSNSNGRCVKSSIFLKYRTSLFFFVGRYDELFLLSQLNIVMCAVDISQKTQDFIVG